jgi:hypothetical protein
MPDTVVDAPPFIVEHPLIKIGAAGSAVEFECAATNLDIAVDQDENKVDTFCGSYTSYKAEKWTITITIAQSYGAAGSWTLLQPLVGTIQPFEIQPDTAAASVDNPVMSGSCLMKAFPFISAAPGEVSEVDVVMAVQGAPAFGIVAPGGLSAPPENEAKTAKAAA